MSTPSYFLMPRPLRIAVVVALFTFTLAWPSLAPLWFALSHFDVRFGE